MRRLSSCVLGAAVLAMPALPAAQAAGAENPAPSCAEGPERIGGSILGTPCADTIVVPPGVEAVNGGGGDDTIVAAPIAAAAECPQGCHLGVGGQIFEGGPGDDVVHGERGNDKLRGGEGNDQLFGGIGDDLLEGGPGNDRLSGGFGGDGVDGEGGDDYVRGDATKDTIVDRGGGNDTLSYSTGVTPGFFDNHTLDPAAAKGLPPLNGERGVYLDLSGTVGDNGVAPFGGGVDKVEGADFETVIGTPFSDYIVGSGSGETIYGGGGADAILGGNGDDHLYGGADGDHLDGGEGADTADGGSGSDHCAGATAGTETSCESEANKGGVVPRDTSKISVGLLAPQDARYAQVYLVGSAATDKVTATYTSASVTFQLGSSSAPFDTSAPASANCDPPAGGTVVCPLGGKPLDSIDLAGLGGADTLEAGNFPSSVAVIVAGGEGDDSLTGGNQSEDVLADGPDLSGPGEDTLNALGGDDALLNNGGADHLFAGVGNDLFLSDSICDGDVLNGGDGSERDNASWAKFESAVEARLDPGDAGKPGAAGGAPVCPGGTLDALQGIEDLEGSPSSDDVFYGSPGNNQMLGWGGSDKYFSGAGTDVILANTEDSDPVIDCGEGTDTALIDRSPYVDVAGPSCESVQEADPNSFKIETQLPPPPPEPESAAGSPASSPGTGTRAPTGPKAPRQSRACLPRPTPGHLYCGERPRWIGFGALGRLDGIHWRHWGSRNAVGFGHLTLLKPCCDPRGLAHARVKASALQPCAARPWYTRLTVSYGRGYRKPFMRRLLSATPCG